jgi:hypothetical protein
MLLLEGGDFLFQRAPKGWNNVPWHRSQPFYWDEEQHLA